MPVKEYIVKTVNHKNMFYSLVAYSFVNAIKKPTPVDVTPCGWLSNVVPLGIEPTTP